MAETFCLRLHPKLKDELGRRADAEGVSLNDVMHRILAMAIERPELAPVPKRPVGRKRKPVSAA